VDRIGSNKSVAKIAGVTSETVRRWRAGDRIPLEAAARLAHAAGVNMDWLATGEGPRDRASHRPASPGLAGQPAAFGEGGDFVAVARYDVRLSAGAGAAAGRLKVVDRIPFPLDRLRRILGRSSAEGAAMVEVVGDSMQPTIGHGDLVMVDTFDTAGREGLFALVVDDDLVVKRVQKIDNGIEVISDNPAYGARRFSGDRADQVRLIGRVVWVARTVR
jgi:phage repressor protein C with HTH and peptisase S24 domain